MDTKQILLLLLFIRTSLSQPEDEKPKLRMNDDIQPFDYEYAKYVVMIERKKDGSYAGTGAIYADNLILTSAGCLYTDIQDGFLYWRFRIEELEIVAGRFFREHDDISRKQIEEWACYNNFAENRDWKNNICLLKLDSPLTLNSRVQTVELPADPVNNMWCMDEGWKLNTSMTDYCKRLHQETTNILAKGFCKKFSNFVEGEICSIYVDHPLDNSLLICGNILAGIGYTINYERSLNYYSDMSYFSKWIEIEGKSLVKVEKSDGVQQYTVFWLLIAEFLSLLVRSLI